MKYVLLYSMIGLLGTPANKPVIHSHLDNRYEKTPMGNRAFNGTALQQAQILLREVKEKGVVSKDSAVIPAPLNTLIGDSVCITLADLVAYATREKISFNEVGLVPHSDNSIPKITADYFVIHDASTPNYGARPFPQNLNQPGWPWNNLDRWNRNVTHVFVNRMGQSKTMADFSEPVVATKFEKHALAGSTRGGFIHVELIQPRKNEAHSAMKGSVAPEEGFTEAQYQRLAFLYIFASVRKGNWLIPAFHACIDDGIYNGHDDPQHFNLCTWNKMLAMIIESIRLNTNTKLRQLQVPNSTQ